MPKVEIYTQPFCGYCAHALRLFGDKGIAVTEIDAPHGSAARRQATQRSGGKTTMPQIFIDDAPIGGCDELLALDRSGRLDPMLAA